MLAAYFQHFHDLILDCIKKVSMGVTLILLGGFVVRVTDVHEGGPADGVRARGLT